MGVGVGRSYSESRFQRRWRMAAFWWLLLPCSYQTAGRSHALCCTYLYFSHHNIVGKNAYILNDSSVLLLCQYADSYFVCSFYAVVNPNTPHLLIQWSPWRWPYIRNMLENIKVYFCLTALERACSSDALSAMYITANWTIILIYELA